MIGDGGIDDGVSSSLNDPAYRYELYRNWKSNLKNCTPPLDVDDFSKNHGLSVEQLEEIVRTFDEDLTLRIV